MDTTPSAEATCIVTRADQPEALRVQRARIEVVKGPDKGAALELGPDGVVVGSAPECDLALKDDAVSRRHFAVEVGEGGFVLRDLGSKNGTVVGNLRVREAVFTGAAEIEVGESRVQFRPLAQHDEFPLSDATRFGPLLGRSVSMRRVFAVLERAAQADTTLLLEGESGTGKDVAAEATHAESPRSDGPFIVVDCGSVQSTLIESELFGHSKGAFTGASSDRVGAFEAGHGGTVFLDEIGELDLGLQPKLLRLIEKRRIKRVGENKYRAVDVRLIAATNRDLKAEVQAGRFREDLYYRLSVLRVRMPALRERRGDVALLAKSFVELLRPGVEPEAVLPSEVVSMLMTYGWPGNVRELRNVVERLLLFPEYPQAALRSMVEGARAETSGDNPDDLYARPYHEARRRLTDHFERNYLQVLLERNDEVVARAAESAGLSRQGLHRLLSKHGLKVR